MGKQKSVQMSYVLWKIQKIFSTCFLTHTLRYSLNLTYQKEFIQSNVLLISIRNQGKKFFSEEACKNHTFLTNISRRTEFWRQK